jgi:AmiR/NasT family two-component response regulator
MQGTIDMSKFGREKPNKGGAPFNKDGASRDHGQDNSSVKALWDLKCAVISERNDDGERLVRELQRLRCNVVHEWPMPPQIPVQYDVVFCALTNDLPQRLPWIPGEPASALVVVDNGEGPLDLRLLHNCAAHGVLHYPATPRSVQAVLSLARGHFLYEKRLRGRIDKLDESLRSMRSVERAKSLLIRVKNITEEEAYNYLRRQAMERRVTIGAVANAIIDSYELLS